MSEPLIVAELQDGVARLTLNDPARLNALSIEMADQASAALDRMLPDARVLVVTGAGKAFCAGANLADGVGAGEADVDGGAILRSHFNPFIQRIVDSPVPVIIGVRGAAAGFGASLALAGDLIVATDGAFFVQAFRNVGLIPDGGSAATLVRAIGRIRAVELMLLAERLPASKAFEWGLISRVVAEDALAETVENLARNFASGPTQALGRIRRMAWTAAESSFGEELEVEVSYQRECARTADHKEGVIAFMEKRPAVFVGR